MLSQDPLRPTIILAPMEGVIDWPMREFLSSLGGLDRCVTEFIRVTDQLLGKKMFYQYCPELLSGGRTRSGIEVYVQLLGGQPTPMAENAQLAAELGAPGIDLNFGCPAKTVNRHDGGAVLLKSPERLLQIISKVRSAVPASVPVSAKVRLGFQDKSLHQEIALAVQDGGASYLTVHARTRDDGYRPPAYWEYIASMKSVVNIPIVANGEIWSVNDYKLCHKQSQCYNVALGRGLVAKPSLAREIKNHGFGALSWPQLWQKLWADYFPLCIQWRSERYALIRLKQWLTYLMRQYPEAHELFAQIKTMESWQNVTDYCLNSVSAAIDRPTLENSSKQVANSL